MKIYPCCKCTRMYKTIRNLWDHLRSKHYISVTFKCTHCYKWFRNHRLVKKHLRAACLTKKSVSFSILGNYNLPTEVIIN